MSSTVCVDCKLPVPAGTVRCPICQQLNALMTSQRKDERSGQGRLPFDKVVSKALNVRQAPPQAKAPDPNLPKELLDWIPSREVYEAYITRELDTGQTDLQVVAKGLLDGENVLLLGDAGGGKNHLGEAVAYYLQLPVFWVNLNGGTTVEDLVGQMTLIKDGNGVVTKWDDGILPLMMRHGGILGLDEVNAMPAEIGFVFQQVTDWRRKLTLVQGGRQVIRAHKNFKIMGTMNPDYRGTKPLNESFRERFGVTLLLDYDKGVEAKLIKNPNLLALADQLRKSFHKTEISSPTSTRLLIDFEKNVQRFGEPLARKFFLNRFDNLDQAAVAEAMKLNLDKPLTTAAKADPKLVKPTATAKTGAILATAPVIVDPTGPTTTGTTEAQKTGTLYKDANGKIYAWDATTSLWNRWDAGAAKWVRNG